jgi:hypothetical protein
MPSYYLILAHVAEIGQILSVLAHNLHRSIQGRLGVPRRARTPKATSRYRYASIRTTGFGWLNVAARILTTAEGLVLRLSDVPEVRQRYERFQTALPQARVFDGWRLAVQEILGSTPHR